MLLLDYIVFATSLVVCGLVGIYYLIKERKQQTIAGKASAGEAIQLEAKEENQEEDISCASASKHAKTDEIECENQQAESRVNEYFLGSQNLQFVPTVCSLFASFFSSVGMLGIPADVYTVGTVTTLSGFMFIPASFVVVFIYLPIYYRNKNRTVFQYLEERFDSQLLRKITAIGMSCAFIVYAAVSAYVPSLAFRIATGIPEWMTIAVTCIVTLSYTAMGGLRAVVLVDTIQAGVMFFGVIFALVVGCMKIGDLSSAWDFATLMKRTTVHDWSWQPWVSHGFWSMAIGNFFSFVVVHSNNQSVLQRCCSLGSLFTAKAAILAMGPFFGLLTTLLWLLALTAFVYYNKILGCDPLANKKVPNLNMIMPYFMLEAINFPGYMGIYFACLFSAAISSMSTAYNTVASLIWEDWLRAKLEPKINKRHIMPCVKMISTGVGVLIGLLAVASRYVPGTAVKICISLSGIFTGSTHAIFFSGVFLPFITTTSLYFGFGISQIMCLLIVLGQIYFQPYSYPWGEFVTDRCPASNSTNATWYAGNSSTAAPTVLSVVAKGSNSELPEIFWFLFSISYTYIPLIAMFICLLIAIPISCFTRYALAKKFPHFPWLAHPQHVKADHLVFRKFWSEAAAVVKTHDQKC